jgi:DNA modification methylase
MKTLDNTNIELIPVDALKPYANNARSHSPAQIKQIARSIERFGFTNPVLADKNFGIIAGHGRVLAAKSLGYAQVPVLRVSHLSDTEKRAYILADNKLALNAGWDKETLAIELQGLIDAEFDVQLTGFSIGESDIILNDAHEASLAASDEPEDAIPEPGESCPVTRPGDIWQLGRHRLICGDARNAEACAALLQGEKADMIFTDPPYNVPIDGHVSGLGAVKHREFAFASGEMSTEAFTTFLTVTLGQSATLCRDGAIAFVCMDWRHMGELLSAGHKVFTELKNLCVWNKTNGGMGTFYRSKYELVFVYKIGTAAHINTFGLGDGGRYRTNVWDYAGANTFRRERMEDLADHPTVKPVALVADAIRDVSKRGGIVLDPFGGSGTTLIAAEKTGRKARLIEVDPVYCDVIVRRLRRMPASNRFELTAACRSKPKPDTGCCESSTPPVRRVC